MGFRWGSDRKKDPQVGPKGCPSHLQSSAIAFTIMSGKVTIGFKLASSVKGEKTQNLGRNGP